MTRGGWWPFVWLLAKVVVLLAIAPIALDLIFRLLDATGIAGRWGIQAAPKVKDWLTLENVALMFLLAVILRWFGRARHRIVVEGFIDHTVEDAKAVSGLSTLLVTELGRLRDLYRQVTEVSIPTAVGVEREGGFGRRKEAAAFLTASADDVTDVLEGAVASEARVEIGPAKIPIGPLLALFNRAARGPRVVGSVHLTEAGGGPTLTAQLVGSDAAGTWRVDQAREPESVEQRKAFLDTMVRELACRMFAQLTLGGSIRWPAVQAFNEYLRLYGDSRRTPRDRARFLKEAQAQLLRAVAEDETFDLAFYNLGVIYTQLAQTELAAERTSEDFTSPAKFDRYKLNKARRKAARMSFLRATGKNPMLWQAHYALAVTAFSELPAVDIDKRIEDAENGRRDRDTLHEVIDRCEQALRIHGRRSVATSIVYDLRGMAEARRADPGDLEKAIASHRKAVSRSWIQLCRAERTAKARPSTDPEVLERARGNAAAALHNLALAHDRRARLNDEVRQNGAPRLSSRQGRDLSAADRIFRAAVRVAGKASAPAAAAQYERGDILEFRRRFGQAADAFRTATRIHAANGEYLARLARANARDWDARHLNGLRGEAQDDARRALDLLTLTFTRSVTPFHPPALDTSCNASLDFLEDTYEIVDPGAAGRIQTIRDLRGLLEKWCIRPRETRAVKVASEKREQPINGIDELAAFRANRLGSLGEYRWFAELQIDLGLARLNASREPPAWKEVRDGLWRLIEWLDGSPHEQHVIDLGLLAHYARALTECGDAAKALRYAAECVRRDPLSVDGRREAGRAHAKLSQYEDAVASWQHALLLSPSDAYLHQELAMCRMRMAGDQHESERRAALIESAEKHLEQAQALFDGEDFAGEAWTRVWRGRVAVERARVDEAIPHFEGARYGLAGTAALLYLGEAYLAIDEHRRAEHAFEECKKNLEREVERMSPVRNVDAGWGDELPPDAVRSRIARGLAEACHMAPGDWQDAGELGRASAHLTWARHFARRVKDVEAREQCLALCLESEAKLQFARGHYRKALQSTADYLRLRPGSDALLREAELLELAATAADGRANDEERLRIAAEYAWGHLQGDDGDPGFAERANAARHRVRRAIGRGNAGHRRP